MAYARAFKSAIKAVDPTWDYGKAIPSGALDGITRESVESQLVKSGNTFVKNHLRATHWIYRYNLYTLFRRGA